MKKPFILALIFLLFTLSCLGMGVKPFHYSKSLENKWAVIWGSSGYQGEQICGDNNARTMANLLKQKYGYSSDNICVLIGNKLNYESELASLEWLRENTDDDSSIILFYSGHGSQNGFASFSHYYLNYLFQNIKYGRLCMVIECCYSGNACEPLSGENRLIIASTKVGSTGGTSSHGSLFRHFFLNEAIKQGLADYNLGGWVSMQEAFNYYYAKDPYRNGTMSDGYGQEFIP